jgi:hypothetical protein
MTGAAPPDAIGEDAKKLATVLTASPNLRARLFANPTKVVGKELPRLKYWDYRIGRPFWPPWKYYLHWRSNRAKLAKRVLEEVADGVTSGTLSSRVNTDAVFEEYFAPIARVSQRSFSGVFYLSFVAFLAGCALIGAGIWIAVDPPSSGNSTVLGSIFGGTGAISALGSLYAMVIRGISNATTDHARLRVVLTGFATELGQLRAYAEGAGDRDSLPTSTLESVKEINSAIRQAMDDAMKLVPASGGSDQRSTTGSSKDSST